MNVIDLNTVRGTLHELTAPLTPLQRVAVEVEASEHPELTLSRFMEQGRVVPIGNGRMVAVIDLDVDEAA